MKNSKFFVQYGGEGFSIRTKIDIDGKVKLKSGIVLRGENLAQYKHEYAENNKEYISEYKKQYANDNKEHIREYKREHYQRNRGYILKTKNFTQYGENGFSIGIRIKEDGTFKDRNEISLYGDIYKQFRKQYQEKHKDINREYQKEYRTNNKESIRDGARRYRINNPEKVREHSKKYSDIRRGWGLRIPINNWFPNSDFHHLHIANDITGEINHRIGLYIPTEIHRAFKHNSNKSETIILINETAMEWYYK
jgi:hypothetical protein